MKRRSFLNNLGFLSFLGVSLKFNKLHSPLKNPTFIATWNNAEAVMTANQHFSDSKSILDAIVKGINTVENNPLDQSVGYGGRPDRDGFVTLDACVMDSNGDAGSVTYLQNIKNAVSVAQKVMTETPHVILSGKGAEQFALDQGFSKEDLLTEETKAQYQKWILEKKYKPVINIENHDTIGMVGLSPDNNLAGACSTSGLAYKMNGRVGDSPIIGAGLFVDNEIGACTATGLGEIVLKNLCSFLVVELMRNGHSPDSACKLALERVLKKEKSKPDYQIGLIAINKAGDFGAYAVFEGFKMAICKNNELLVEDSKYFYKYD